MSNIENKNDHCCCSFSETLIHTLGSLLPRSPAVTISVGSGHGLLEFSLLRKFPETTLHAIEVTRIQPQYLPESRVHYVNSSLEIWSGAAYAQLWIFVYPRDFNLIKQYLETYASGEVKKIVWIGPKADQAIFESVLDANGWETRVIEDSGLPEYECFLLGQRS